MGYGQLLTVGTGLVRGGSWENLRAGVFATDLNRTQTIATSDGFRCIYNP